MLEATKVERLYVEAMIPTSISDAPISFAKTGMKRSDEAIET